MTGVDSYAPPPGWTTDRFGDKSASFRNEPRGLKVDIRAVHKGSNVRRRAREPTHYTVQLQQDWFAKGTLGKREMGAKVETWAEALAVAQEFMAEFSREVKEMASEEIRATHAAVDDHGVADDLITTGAAAEALADAAGYSDDLLLSVLDAKTNGQYQFVAHRDGDTLTTVVGAESEFATDNVLQRIYGVLPVDRTELEHVLGNDNPFSVVVHVGDHSVYRFIFENARETDIVLPRGTQVLSPEFESTVANVLEEKW